MTTLINLESYLECCEYAHLFDQNVNKLIPNPKSLPNAYRDFCKKHLPQAFLPVPALAIAQPQTLRLRKQTLSQSTSHIGFAIADQHEDQIFIVREANSLEMRSFDVPQYLYANVYRYWSYAAQLMTLTNAEKPLVIYDLDSFTPSQIIPFTFEKALNAPYLIPIIDTRSKSQYDSLKLSKPYEDVYNNICDHLADKIVADLGISLENITFVSRYLQKINLFQKIIPNCSSDRIPLIIEIADTFYPYNLDLSELEKIICQNLPIAELQNIIAKNSNSYNFALISSTIQSPRLKQYLQQHLQQQFLTSTLLIVDTSQNIFKQIWQNKINQQFPLYGQHLDQISFLVARDKETIEINLPSDTCYEGEQEKIQYASYLKDGKQEQEFTLKSASVNLQFTINDESFVSRETDLEQSYLIENQYFKESENSEIKIKIRFRVKPGIIPKLEILDNQNRILHSRLTDYEKPSITLSETSGFLPSGKISDSRIDKSYKGLETICEERYINDLRNFVNSISQNITAEAAAKRISQFRSKWKEKILPVYVIQASVQNELTGIFELYTSMARSFSNIFPRLSLNNKNHPSIQIINQGYNNLILIISQNYAMTQFANLEFLHNLEILSRKNVKGWNELLYSAARTACNPSRQIFYLNLFNKPQDRSITFYRNGVYLWGYARILMWYINFNDPSIASTCKQHFGILAHHCCSLEASIPENRSYLRDALIALIYLLTFRESDPEFVKKDSQLYNEAKRLCQKLYFNPIKSTKANIEFPLNSFFDQLLDGNVTKKEVDNMIEID